MKEARYLVDHMYTADAAAHIFKGRLYIYPSHDIESGIAENDNGDHFDMRDYHVLSMDSVDGEVFDHGVALDINDHPYGPFTYQGVIMTPVVGWTTHHSICEFKGHWYLFHHDCVPSGGKTWLRSLKVIELEYTEEGSIKTIDGTAI